jgi:hypothetical protein
MTIQQHASFDSSAAELNATSKLVKAWESKNAKNAARAGGVSLMALSLAACGGSDDVAVDITSDNAEILLAAVTAVDATATTVAEVASNANAAGVTAGATAANDAIDQAIADAGITVAADATSAETIAAVAESDNVSVADTAKTAALTAANGTTYATVDAAFTAGSDTNNADAVAAALTDAGGTAHATVDAAITSNDTAIADAATTTATAAAEASLVAGTGFDTVAALNAAYTAAIAATPTVNATLETTQDIINGTVGDDAVVGTNLTFNTNDVLVGGDGTDTLTINSTAATVAAAPTVVGFETITYNITSSDLAQAAVTLTNVSSGTVTVNQLANGAVNTAAITNAGDITLSFGGKITGEATIGQVAASTLNVNVGTADDITITGGTSGSATVTGTAATFVEADVTMTTTGSATVVGGSGLATVDVDAKTMNVTTTSDTATITLTGMGAADTGTVSIGAAADIVAFNAVETLNISTGTASGDGTQTAASVATVTTNAATTYNLTGANDIVLAGDEAMFDGKTVANTDATGATSVQLTTVATSDLEKVANGTTIDVAEVDYADGTAATLTVKNNATVKISVDIDNTADATDEALTIDSDTLASGAETLNLVYTASQTDKTDGIVVSDFETVNLSTAGATGAISVAKLTAGTTSAVTLGTGSQNMTFDAMTAKTFDATGYTGDITMTVATTVADSATFGAGDDDVTMTSGDTVVLNGGDGTDILGNTGTDFATATISNFEVIELVDGVNTFAASQLSGSTMSVKGFNGVDDDIAITGTAAMDQTTVDLGTLTLDGNVIASAVTVSAATIAASLSLGMNYAITGTAVIDEVTAGTVTGDMVVSTSTGADIIVTGSGDDTITTGNGIDTVNAGTGANSIDITETAAGAAADDILVMTATGVDTVTGFGAADQIIFLADDEAVANNGVDADLFDAADVVFAATDATTTTDTVVVLATTDYAETDSTGTIQDNHVHVITDAAGFASVSALLDSMDTTGTAGDNESLVLGFYNSTDSQFQLHLVTDTGTDAAGRTDTVSVEMVAFTDIAATEIASAFADTNFGVIAL